MIGSSKRFQLVADWRAATIANGPLTLQADAQYASKVFFEYQNTPHITQPGHWIANGRVHWSSQDEAATVGIWSKNIFNEETYAYGFDGFTFGLGYEYFMRNAPRTFGADVTLKF